MKAAIVGVGLIGGSFALTLKDNGICDEVIGVDNSERNRAKALELGLVDRTASLAEAVAGADLVVLATPVDSIPLLAVKVLNQVDRQVVIDMGSTKQELCEVIAQHPRRGRFVATHPMWGTEYSGPEAAEHDAFRGRTVVFCDRELSDPDAVELVERVYERIGMPIKYMSAEEQDTHTAYVSHISHITSFALALTVLEKEREEEHIFDLAGQGSYRSVVLMEWADGEPLGRCLARLCGSDDREGLGALARRFDRLGLWLLEADFAHGDLKQDNLIVMPDGSLRLIDYDGVYLPSLAGRPGRQRVFRPGGGRLSAGLDKFQSACTCGRPVAVSSL